MAGLVLCVGVALIAYVFLSRPQLADLPPARPGTALDTRDDAAAELLNDLTAALDGGSPAALAALAAPGDPAAARELAQMKANVRRLGITGLSMRYVDDDTSHRPAVAQGLARRAWVGDVQLRWRVAGFDRSSSEMEVTMTFLQTRDGAAFVSARLDYGDPAPLWLLSKLAVEQSRTSLVMSAKRPGVVGYSRLANQAVRDVRKVLPRWPGPLVVEVPSSQGELERLLGAEPDTYAAIAAVTTPVDGSNTGDSPVHIMVNPPVFGPLGEKGAQIVMSHEAAHVATHAATSSMPTWLLEGFADYVALAYVDLPVEVTASQILAQVRSDGVPDHLPNQDDFKADSKDLGASYEAAWLACRLLGETYGRERLLRFYEQADRDGNTEAAFRQVLGTSESVFTDQWRDYLRRLAR
ncbi:hypothetical protein [Nocardioides mesophilus]|uniref:Peptidase MA-like domain-containing protein n=1 Tax=Nocardioides mesophilus TaxID=433659 RepID=A0A7G9RC42_9ACTN|nr:hypothetical protein [Nocardioides mesophilus]QNN53167.1 hypothetical protein H9L09_01330 [Nocardioides mesophilus]